MTAAELKDKGNDAFKAGKFDLAEEFYTAALKLEPDDTLAASLYSNRSVTRCRLTLYNEALDDAEECIKKKPEWFKGYQRSGEACEYLGYRMMGIKSYEDGQSHSEPNPEAVKLLQGKLNALLEKKNEPRNKQNPFLDHDVMDRLMLHPEMLLICDEDDVPPMVGEIRRNPEVFQRVQGVDKRISELAKIMRDVDDIDELFVDGAYRPYYRFMKKFRAEQENMPRFVEEVLPPEPDIEDIIKDFDTAEKCYEKGVERFELCRFTQAIKCFQKAQRLEPNAMKYVYEEGHVLYYTRKYLPSLEVFEKALKLKEEFGADIEVEAMTYKDMGIGYLQLRDFEKAAEYLEISNKLKPGDREVGYRLSDALYLRKKKRKHDKFNEELALIEYDLGKRFYRVAKFERAIHHLSEAIIREPDKKKRSHVYRKRGACYFELKNYEKAIENAKKSLRIEDSDRIPLYKRIQDNYDDLRGEIRDDCYLKPFYLKGDAYLQYGIQAEREGDKEEAKERFLYGLNAFKRSMDVVYLPTGRSMEGFRTCYDKVDPDRTEEQVGGVDYLSEKYD